MQAPMAVAPLLSILPEANFATFSSDVCCAALQATSLRDQVLYPFSAGYNESATSYFATNAQLSPWCIVQPYSAEDVSIAVSTLVQADESQCRFAVRSGGHTPGAGVANIEQGITIDLSMMNSTTYHEDKGIASILPGARWESVYTALDPYGVTVPGGRSGKVGVGGFLLGGGNSFYTARVGFACDNVENFEIVLASGSIINANRTSHPDLHKALKGGSNNFGVVTRFDLKTLPLDLLWGGLVVYDNSTTAQQIAAAVDFTDNLHTDPYAHWIGTWRYSSDTDANIIAHALEYTKPVPNAPPFREFAKIANISDTTRLDTIGNLAAELDLPQGYRNIFTTGTYLNNPQVLEKAIALHNANIEKAKASAKSASWNMNILIQPWPKLFWEHSQAKGGNVLGLDRFDENLVQLLFYYTWAHPTDDPLFQPLATTILSDLNAHAQSLAAHNEFIYLDYADTSQDPLAGYGEDNGRFLRKVAQKFDPHAVFQERVPGFKLG
ncbi:FAD-binding domain-containing protein [Aspergillus heteromorphus CBS 117.55]|uniref:FAD-binding domain-containing protein n=1 Tax=Aspergillus heteromorphus CBS 117.55 TaxID=1448321 RepID=A0A317WXP9_9EURO|nr:FAD-binding domain-containing protein [Aspergillus heteromorphus CBS 117.55]PWY90671.1 FAD-binding domain-containing protein [Aspergillus heteromorphus CBS 117.55]